MNKNYIDENSTTALRPLLVDLISDGDIVNSRAGMTKELTHVGITLTRPLDRELLVFNRKHNLAAQIAETMWVLAGRNDIEWLAHYLPRAPDFSDDGVTWRAAYGTRLRQWRTDSTDDGFSLIDQLKYVVELLKGGPGTRQAVMSIWDPAVDSQPGKDVPCNDWLHFISRFGYLDLHVAVRSNDVIWGWSGINTFEWSALLEVVAHLAGLDVGKLHFSVTSMHIYEQHWAKAEAIIADNEIVLQLPDESPRFNMGGFNRDVDNLDALIALWFSIEYKIRNGTFIREDIDGFPEPMFRSWLRIIEWWWTADGAALTPLTGTRLYQSAYLALQPKLPVPSMIDFIDQVHREKGAAYGGSWKKRGEMLSILANIARKVDRLLVGGETSDETLFDTAMDTLVYLAKYRWWLTEHGAPSPVDLLNHAAEEYNKVRELLEFLEVATDTHFTSSISELAWELDRSLETVTLDAIEGSGSRYLVVDKMLKDAYLATAILWEKR